MVININTSKIYKFVEELFFGIDLVETVFVSSINSSHIITKSSTIPPSYLPFFPTTCCWIPNIISFTHVMFFRIFKLTPTSLFLFWFESHFLTSNLHLHLHDVYFFNVVYSFIPVTMFKTLRFKSSALFGTHAILNRSSGVLQLPTHLSKLIANG